MTKETQYTFSECNCPLSYSGYLLEDRVFLPKFLGREFPQFPSLLWLIRNYAVQRHSSSLSDVLVMFPRQLYLSHFLPCLF